MIMTNSKTIILIDLQEILVMLIIMLKNMLNIFPLTLSHLEFWCIIAKKIQEYMSRKEW
jgi:hypothetical protein